MDSGEIGHSEEVPMYGLDAAQYLAVAQTSALKLRWNPVSASGHEMAFRTSGSGYADGEIVTVTTGNKKATLSSRPANEYYSDAARHPKNVRLLADAVAADIEAQDKADRSRHPMHREKYGALVPSKSYLVT